MQSVVRPGARKGQIIGAFIPAGKPRGRVRAGERATKAEESDEEQRVSKVSLFPGGKCVAAAVRVADRKTFELRL